MAGKKETGLNPEGLNQQKNKFEGSVRTITCAELCGAVIGAVSALEFADLSPVAHSQQSAKPPLTKPRHRMTVAPPLALLTPFPCLHPVNPGCGSSCCRPIRAT